MRVTATLSSRLTVNRMWLVEARRSVAGSAGRHRRLAAIRTIAVESANQGEHEGKCSERNGDGLRSAAQKADANYDEQRPNEHDPRPPPRAHGAHHLGAM